MFCSPPTGKVSSKQFLENPVYKMKISSGFVSNKYNLIFF